LLWYEWKVPHHIPAKSPMELIQHKQQPPVTSYLAAYLALHQSFKSSLLILQIFQAFCQDSLGQPEGF